MAIYTVLAPKVRDGDALPDPMKVVFVKEGFCWPALFFAVPWLIFRRLWWVLAAYIVVGIALGAIGNQTGDTAAGSVMVLVHFLFALEANELRRWTLRRHGYVLVGVVEGRGLEEAEIRYFAGAEAAPGIAPIAPVPPTPPTPPAPPPKPWPAQPSAEAGDVVGLFPAPGAVP